MTTSVVILGVSLSWGKGGCCVGLRVRQKHIKKMTVSALLRSDSNLRDRLNPEQPAEGDNSPSRDRASVPPRSPIPSAKLPISHFLKPSPPPAKSKSGACKRKASAPEQPTSLNKLPRFLWAAFGKVRGPLKRHLRRRKCGQAAQRARPWSKAPCVACLFDVKWFEVDGTDDQLDRLMGSTVSPRPNRASRQPHNATSGGVQQEVSGVLTRSRQRTDVADVCPRRLSAILEEDEEDGAYLAAEREFTEQYGAALPPDSEFESVQQARRRARQILQSASTAASDEDGGMSSTVEESSTSEAQQETNPVKKPVRRALF
ncbi:hypothetical protein PoB_002007800 [Plakobranchus ocellatus]|uniref:Uncharacterized protein n=1 Tax=Plakobranchus ocellatus TaxID=259542 RepID=A0AAV3ZFM8_9GAST|nr:hypothetical protein PoB_002007800 [Plakobranchus ocellatus]